MKNIKTCSVFLFMLLVLCGWVSVVKVFAQDTGSKNADPVELNGDVIEYKAEEGKMVATGNVLLKQKDTVLYCDKVEFYKEKKEAHAEGNVILKSGRGEVWADKAFFNFATKKGEFTNARFMADPLYGRARSIIRVGENYYILKDGYLTTSDYDTPGYRIKARRLDVYPDDKAVARDSVMYLGSVPIMYMPKYVQDLRTDRPHFSFIPGYSKEFGPYALMTYRAPLTGRIEMLYHLDLRERKGIAWGIDAKYNAAPYGTGLVRTYYTKETKADNRWLWEQNTEPVVKHQQARVEWRHMVDIDPATFLIGQYYRIRDPNFMVRYFPREHQQDESPATYVLLTHSTSATTSSLRFDRRVNRDQAMVERLPEASFSLSNQELGTSGFYFKSTNTASSLVYKDPAPSDNQKRTLRLDTDNDLSHPFKVAFLEVNPHVGTEQTYYWRALEMKDNNSIRGLFKTGVDLSTKFYKIYNAHFDKWGFELNNVRHVITPTVSEWYQHAPTMPSSKFYQYDAMDNRAMSHQVTFGIENKLQTKRKGVSVDFFRSLFSVPYRLNDDPAGPGLGDMTVANEFYANQYVSLHEDMTYSNDLHQLQTVNVSIGLNDQNKWDLNIGQRKATGGEDLFTSQLSYKFNPLWKTVIYEQFESRTGQLRQQQYSFVRDLHSWEVEFAFIDKNHYQDSGSEIWFIFRIKAFPSVAVNGGSSFATAKAGSQSKTL